MLGISTAWLVLGVQSPKPGKQLPEEPSENGLQQRQYPSPANGCHERIFCSPGDGGFCSLQGGISRQFLLTGDFALNYVRIYRSSCDKSSLAVRVTLDREPWEQPTLAWSPLFSWWLLSPWSQRVPKHIEMCSCSHQHNPGLSVR